MKSEINEIMNRNNGRIGAIKNFGISLKLHGFHSSAISGNVGDSAYRISGDYRARVIETEHWKAATLAESRMLQVNR